MLKLVPPTAPRRRAAPPAGELALIERIRRRAASAQSGRVKLGIGDDCAILSPPPGHDLLVTTDFCLEDRHFRRGPANTWHSPASIGHRTLARGLSDLAAMGAQPLAAFLSLALPKSLARDTNRPDGFLDGFLDGLLALARQYNVPLAGGDTSESPSPHVLADIVLLGSVPRNTALRRSGAKPGDLLYVTGALGGAATELASLAKRRSRRADLLLATSYSQFPALFPRPRLAAGQALRRRRLATACIDLSDGLSTDLAHLCTASHVAVEVDAAALPLHPLTQTLTPAAAMHSALHGGEDYELLFTAPAHARVPKTLGGVALTRIGRILPVRRNRPQMALLTHGAPPTELVAHGWEHLR